MLFVAPSWAQKYLTSPPSMRLSIGIYSHGVDMYVTLYVAVMVKNVTLVLMNVISHCN